MPSQIKVRKFCGPACVGLSRKTIRTVPWVTLVCPSLGCGKTFEVQQGQKGRRKYCSRKCQSANAHALNRTGKAHSPEARQKMSESVKGKQLREKSSQWKGGRFLDSAGYAHVMIETLPPVSQDTARRMTPTKYIMEHRIVMAMSLGRPLEKTELVHHLNGIKDDNRPENLTVESRVEHSRKHRETEAELRRVQGENLILRSLLGLSPTDGTPTSSRCPTKDATPWGPVPCPVSPATGSPTG